MKKFWVVITVVALIGTGILGCAKKAAEKKPTKKAKKLKMETVRYGHRASANLLPIYVAKENGYFEKNGINLEMVEVEGSSLSMKALAAGELDAAIMAFEILTKARMEGVPVKMVASLMYKPPGRENSCFAVLKDSPIKTLEDCKGKVIAGNPRNICPWFHTMAALDEAGLKEGDYQYKELSGAKAANALQAGTVDAAAYLIDPHITILGDKVRAIFWWNNDNAPCPCGHCFTEKMIKEKPDVVRRWVKSLQEGIRFTQTNEEDARRILAKYLDVPEDVALKCRLPGWDKKGRLFADLAEKQLKWMQKYGMIEEIPPVEELYDYTFTGKITVDELHPER